MRVLFPLLLIAAVAIVYLTFRCMSLSRRMKGLREPELWLPRKERQAYARELLARERDQYETSRQEALVAMLREELKGPQ